MRKPDSANFPASALPLRETAGKGRTEVEVEVVARGRDVLATIGGGDAHVGAVAVSSPGAADGPFRSLTVIPPHKEGPLAEAAADRLGAATGASCVVVVGIHQDDAKKEEIAAMVANVGGCLDRIEVSLAAAAGGRRQEGE